MNTSSSEIISADVLIEFVEDASASTEGEPASDPSAGPASLAAQARVTMREQIEVVYEGGVFRPLAPLSWPLQEHQRLTVTIERTGDAAAWLVDADPSVSLEAVRQALAKVPGTLAQAVYDEREER